MKKRKNNKKRLIKKKKSFRSRPAPKKAEKIYLDYSSTTPIDPKVLRTMLPYLKENFGNPSSVHYFGQKAQVAIEESRQKIADFLKCSSEEIIFTGSATEANNLAIRGVVEAVSKAINRPVHIITTKIEHKSVLEPFKYLEKQDTEVTFLPVDNKGRIKISDLAKKIKENTALVSIMYANNETGTIQQIAEIGKLLENINRIKEKSKTQKTYFHTDAVQAANYLDCNVEKLGVDLLTLSGHKIYGPKGVGVSYIKKGTQIEPLILGGGQERGMRSGTENVASILAIGTAISEIKKRKAGIIKIKKLRNKLIRGILNKIPDSQLNSPLEKSLPNIANFSFKGVEGEAIVVALDQKGICVSTGSACAEKSLEPSYVLLGIGLDHEQAHSSIRFSLGKYTTEKEINQGLRVLPEIVERLRQISGHIRE